MKGIMVERLARRGIGYMTTTSDGKEFHIQNGLSVGRYISVPDKAGAYGKWQKADRNNPWVISTFIHNSIGQWFWPVKVEWMIQYEQGLLNDGYIHAKWIRASRIDRQEFIGLLRECEHHRPFGCHLSPSLCGLQIPRPDLDYINMVGVDLENATFKSGYMEGANFMNARLVAARFRNCDLRNVSFIGAKLLYASFEYCDTTGASFWGANVDETVFVECKNLNLSGSAHTPKLVKTSKE